MSEQSVIIEHLRGAGVADGIRWAYVSAIARTLDDYSEDAGYGAAWLGTTRFTLFCDRLDRVFSCEKYALQAGADPSDGLDLLHVELTKHDIATMPELPPDLVRRDNLNHSPGWAFGSYRFLLASSTFGKIDRLPWPQKSPTKQQVARQPNPEPLPSLFDGFAPEEVGGLSAALDDPDLDLDTLVLAHSLDAVGGRTELVFGRPQINDGGGNAWHWYEDLLSTPPIDGGRRASVPSPSGPDTAPDAHVRLRRQDAANESEASGPQ